jgi:hypothetical protein
MLSDSLEEIMVQLNNIKMAVNGYVTDEFNESQAQIGKILSALASREE